MSTVAFAVCLVALYAFVAHRVGRWQGLAAVMVAAASDAHVFAYEARPYALLLAFNALAFVCWQRATEDGVARSTRRIALVLLAVSIAAAVSSHYYGVLVPLPFAVAEVVRLWTRRQLDWPLLVAVAAGVAPLVAYRDLINAGVDQAVYFFSPPSWRVAVETYELYGGPLIVPTVMALALSVIVMMAPPLVERVMQYARARQSGAVTPSHEWVACVTLLLLPVVAFVLATLTGTGSVARYTLTWIIGLALCAGLLTQYLRGSIVVAAVLSFALWIGMREAQGIRHLWLPPIDVPATFAALHRLPSGQVAVAHPHVFTQLQYYLSPELRQRVIFVQRISGAVAGGDTGAIAIREVSKWQPMPITDMDALTQQTQFYLYTPPSWIVEDLRRRGAELRLLGTDEAVTPFAVSRPGVLSLYEVRMPSD